jgi:hypothetical protein
MVGAGLPEVPEQPLRADVVEVGREDHPRPLQRQDAAGLDVAAVGADDHPELHPVALEDGEVAAPIDDAVVTLPIDDAREGRVRPGR